MCVTGKYSEALMFADPRISWQRSYFRAENLKFPSLKRIRPVYEKLLQYSNFTCAYDFCVLFWWDETEEVDSVVTLSSSRE